VLVERFVAPPLKRENEPFTLDVVLKSTNPTEVQGKLTVLHSGRPMDLDPYTEGMQATRIVRLKPGPNVEHIRVPALTEPGVHDFEAVFEPETVASGSTSQPVLQGDTLLANNTARAFTFVKGKGQVLYIDNVAHNAGRGLRDAL